ncbi:MAG: DUF456 family protein [Proteobacteria bacterium]|nr:DUF456 family protein [Pseudomonadota bacterium]
MGGAFVETIAWCCAVGGLFLGGLGALVPGFPGSAVALLGLVAFAALTGFEIVTQEALVLATLVAGAGAVGQLLAPMVGSRLLGGTAGAATGAALGAAVGAIFPIPGMGWLLALICALVLGLITQSKTWVQKFRGAVGVFSGCLVSMAADLAAVLGVGAILAVADFLSAITPH